MACKPILFSGPMVRANLEDRKTNTRRVVDVPDGTHEVYRDESGVWQAVYGRTINLNGTPVFADGEKPLKPRFRPGDILWVRETWKADASDHDKDGYVYRADGEREKYPNNLLLWRPSIFMPRAAARLFLRVTDVRIERVQEMINYPTGPQDPFVLEGFDYACDFIATWNNLNAKRAGGRYAWDKNPWVWVIVYERIAKPEGWPLAAQGGNP